MPKKKSPDVASTADPVDAERELLYVLKRLTKEVEALNQQVGTLAEQSEN